MSIDLLHCASCHRQFRRETDSAECPYCGSALPADATVPLDQTVLLAEDDRDVKGSHLQPDEDDLLTRELHVYRLETLLGAGAMGRVYLASHKILHRKCAVKILSPRAARHDEDYVSRFHDEGRAAAALIHPNIVTTHAIGEDGGFHFLEMEFVAGETLQHLIEREGALTPLRATRIAALLADALAVAHRSGIVHGDLKAENVLLTAQGAPKIADFGLAKRVSPGDESLTGKLIGTPNYMAPEMFSGAPANTRTDVYALGVCYFKMLTGRLPFAGVSLSRLAHAVCNEALPSLRAGAPEASLEMLECLSRLISRAPGNRPRDGTEAAQLLRAVLGESRDLDSLLREGFDGSGDVRWRRDGSKYTLDLSLPDGRKQTIFIENTSQKSSEKLLLIYSICCAADPRHYEEALRMNADCAHGAISLRTIDGRDYFVMLNAYPRATVDPEEVRASVLEIGFRADEIERRLTGRDVH